MRGPGESSTSEPFFTQTRLVKTNGFAHRALDEQALDVLPVLLQQRHEEVDRQHDVAEELVLGHLDVADGDTQAENLLQLELDGGADLRGLVLEVVSVRDGRGEFTGLMQTRAKKTRDLLDQSFRSEEGIVLLGKFLDQLLVLVQLLQVVNGLELHTNGFGLVAVMGITEDADGHARTRDVGEFHGARETLVTLGIVVLETDLELDGLRELARLLLRSLDKPADGFSHS